MNNESSFVPKILLCGDEAEFISRVGVQRPFKIVGHLAFSGEKNGQKFDYVKDGKVLLDDKICEIDEPLSMLRREVDFLVFNDSNLLGNLSSKLGRLGFYHARTVSTLEFKNLPRDNFYDVQADIWLMDFLKNLKIKTLLDVDAHFINGYLFTKGTNDLTEIDCVSYGLHRIYC